MSSFFRSAKDVTASTDESTSDASSDESGSDHGEEASTNQDLSESQTISRTESQYISKVKSLPTSASVSTEDVTSTLSLVGGSTTQHFDYVLHALLEQRCSDEALAWYQEHHGHEHYFTREDPEVEALAQEKYKFMAEQLGRHNLVPQGPEQESARVLRGAYREGLDLLSKRGPLPSRPALQSRPGSQTSLTTAMRNLAIPNAGSRTRLEMSSRQLELFSRSQEGVHKLPPVLQPYIDHPMVELSRYRRDYEEVRMVGKGGYGRVYHVKHRLDGSNYAVKKIGLSPARVRRIQERGQEELDSLLSELRMLARFDHPNIVRYYGGWLEYSAPVSQSSTTSFRQPPLHRLLEAPELEHDATSGSEIPLPDSPTDLDVVFERSIGEVLGEVEDLSEDGDKLPELRFHGSTHAKRLRANSGSTTASAASAGSKRSTVHSIGEDVENSREADPEFAEPTGTVDPESSSYLETSQSEAEVVETQLTLHIQMSLHPLSLADFLSSSRSADDLDPSNARHCFHIQPSLQILLCIMDGVEYLHQCGVVHRDLKPSNIFLSVHRSFTPACVALSKCTECRSTREENRDLYLNIRIGDFGLVTTIAQADPTKPMHSKAVGTELYRPLHATANADERLDVFALGVIATELLFPFSTRMERHTKLYEVRNGELAEDSFERSLGDRGKELVACIKGMTCSDELLRHSCSEARKRLESLLC